MPNPRPNTSGLRRGGPGRPPGVPNKASQEIKEAARAIVEDADYRESVKRRMKAGKAPHLEVLFHHYAYGKPKESVEHKVDVNLADLLLGSHRSDADAS